MINEGEQVYCRHTGIAGHIHLIESTGLLVVIWETGKVSWGLEPIAVTKKAEQAV